MKEQVYESNFTIKFNNKEIEAEYVKMKENSIIQYNKILTPVLFFTSIIPTVLNSFIISQTFTHFQMILYTSYASSFIYLICLVLSIFYSKKKQILKYVLYIDYFLLMFTFCNIRFPAMNFWKNVDILYYLFPIELILRFSWIILGLQGFFENLILNSISVVTIWVLHMPSLKHEEIISNVQILAGYTCMFMFVTLLAYALERQHKNAFYFQMVLSKEAKWLFNILDNMNTGFLSVKGERITYMNSFLIKRFQRYIEDQHKFPTSESIVNINEYLANLIVRTDAREKFDLINIKNSENFFRFILSDLGTETLNDVNVQEIISEFKRQTEYCSDSQERKNFLKTFCQHISLIPEIDDFILIGDKHIEVDDSENYYEIYCRLKGDEIDLLFNDVTRSKFNEKQNAEFKYKTLFLSKVAHEFRNPLVSITELVNQLSESEAFKQIQDKQNSNSTNEELNKTIMQIKSMSEFLLVLVKDLNYYAENQLGKNVVLEEKEIKLEELLVFCENITESLLIKSNKCKSVEFRIDKKEGVPDEIVTDEWKLKQILLNLLSNAVKFTLYGKIVLEISLTDDKQNLQFMVKDSGIGIKEEQKKNVFKTFERGHNTIDDFESGLGLSIANELANLLGGEKIKFDSVFENGSSFLFTIPIKESGVASIKTLFECEICKKCNNCLDCQKCKICQFCINCKKCIGCKKSGSVESLSKRKGSYGKIEIKYFPEEESPLGISNVEQTVKNEYYPIKADLLPEEEFILEEISNSKNNNNIIAYPSDINSPSRSISSPIVLRTKPQIKIDKSNTFSILDFVTDNSSLEKLRKPQNLNRNMTDPNFPNPDKDNFLNILIVDDENFVRQSIKRILSEISNELNIRINIIEAEDGLETLYLIYKCIKSAVKISMIFSDENMVIMKGTRSSQLVKEILDYKKLTDIPIYLVTAYDCDYLEKYMNSCIVKVLQKPLSKEIVRQIIVEKLNN